MPEPMPFLAAAERLADRFRSMPQSRLTALAPEGLALARRLAGWAQQLEGLAVRELPEVGIFAVGDQIALAAHELAAAAAERRTAAGAPSAPGADDEGLGEDAADTEVEQVLAEAGVLVAEVAQRLATTRSART
ncbi:hypothetical protein [Streptacidiphilus albus]|uniref:hypothetical protein n=1 Tax=Streptacidiphilus albus TaxID=105425 RepID=UPI00054B9E97|nr:hypothetical protein [Streptacidiphilus albus]